MSATRVLFGLLWPGLGGHTRTALAIAHELRRRGLTIDFVVDATARDTSLIRDAGFLVPTANYLNGDFFQHGFRQSLAEFVRERQYDAIHWFEKVQGVYDAARVAAQTKRAFVWTVTSGGPPPDYHGLHRVVVYTPEVADDARRRAPRMDVQILPARISLEALSDTFVETSRCEIRRRLNLPDSTCLVVRLARCSRLYVPSVHQGLELTLALNRAGRPAMFLHAGFVDEPAAAAEISRAVSEANAAARRTVAYTETRDVTEGVRYLAAADICIASGRSAIEALALRKPTLVSWRDRYLGLVSADNVADMAQSNFQGRLTTPTLSNDSVSTRMFREVGPWLDEPERYSESVDICSAFVRERFSLEHAADAYVRMYGDSRVSYHHPLRQYGNPRRLARELRRWLPRRLRSHRAMTALRRARDWSVFDSDE